MNHQLIKEIANSGLFIYLWLVSCVFSYFVGYTLKSTSIKTLKEIQSPIELEPIDEIVNWFEDSLDNYQENLDNIELLEDCN